MAEGRRGGSRRRAPDASLRPTGTRASSAQAGTASIDTNPDPPPLSAEEARAARATNIRVVAVLPLVLLVFTVPPELARFLSAPAARMTIADLAAADPLPARVLLTDAVVDAWRPETRRFTLLAVAGGGPGVIGTGTGPLDVSTLLRRQEEFEAKWRPVVARADAGEATELLAVTRDSRDGESVRVFRVFPRRRDGSHRYPFVAEKVVWLSAEPVTALAGRIGAVVAGALMVACAGFGIARGYQRGTLRVGPASQGSRKSRVR